MSVHFYTHVPTYLSKVFCTEVRIFHIAYNLGYDFIKQANQAFQNLPKAMHMQMFLRWQTNIEINTKLRQVLMGDAERAQTKLVYI